MAFIVACMACTIGLRIKKNHPVSPARIQSRTYRYTLQPFHQELMINFFTHVERIEREYKKSEKKGIRVDEVNTVVIHIDVVK